MRYLIPIVIVVAIVAGLAFIKSRQFATLSQAMAVGQKAGPPPEVVGTTVAQEDSWEGTFSAVGTVAAVRGVAVSNEAPGVVTAIHFESGQVVRAGQVLVELDTSVERAQLESLEARRNLAELGVGRTRKLAEKQMVAQAQIDTDEAQLRTSSADEGALKAQIDRKTVRAPFGGRLGIRAINLGQYLNPGTTVTVLESLGSVYVDFTLPQQYLPAVKVGTPVRVAVGRADGTPFLGTIGALDPTIDATTRSIKLRASIPNKQDKLRPGMFVQVTVVRDTKLKVVTAPATAVVHAPYGDSVFVVEEKPGPDGQPARFARQQFVRLGVARGDFVAIDDGVKAGEELVTAGAFKLRNGSRVVINNDVKPTPALAPHVDNL
ncbi:MAG TPA: efflux RND transporter periplasmic adaptor subunit [Polyangia bacterium]|nr:efflux RND transporter periplasmic adaptor subunit [Polyangia bacterium]